VEGKSRATGARSLIREPFTTIVTAHRHGDLISTDRASPAGGVRRTVPLLVLDMWEHAYYLQYQHVKGDWVKAFWKIVNWEDVAERFRSVRSLDLAL
jgi:superoxide dismutase